MKHIHTKNSNPRYSSHLFGRFGLVILALFMFIGCGRAPTPMDNYCTEQCSEMFEKHVEGTWQGNDFYWEKTRCLCHNNDFGTEHFFDLLDLEQ